MVVPAADPAYRAARPELAYAESEVLPLADGLGLSPGMTGLHSLWQSGQLTVVRGVGYPEPDHSHFRSMDIWQTASPDTPVSSGWVGRWLDHAGDDPLLALNMGDVLPPLAVGEKATAAALSLTRAPEGALDGGVLDHFAADDPKDGTAARQVVASYAAARTVRTTFAPVTTGIDPTAARSKGADGLSAQLDLVARCIGMGAPTRVYSVSLSGFDTHADEKGTQTAQLGLLDQALTRFRQSLGRRRGRRTSWSWRTRSSGAG